MRIVAQAVVSVVLAVVCAASAVYVSQPATKAATRQAPVYKLTPEADAFLEDLSKRSFMFFWEQADPGTGIVRDRSRTDGAPASPGHRLIGSIASTGFGLTGLCIAAERGWLPRDQLVQRARTTLTFFAEKAYQNHGWFYHWVNIETGEREWKSEVSSIDTALLMGGVLSVRQCFKDDPAIVRHADAIYRRLDFTWMLNGHESILSHGWRPESGFITHRWALFSEAMILYILGLGSPTHPLPAASWAAWGRPELTYGPYTYVTTVPPLFLHQYSHAWVDFRGWRDPVPPQPDWFDELGDRDARAEAVLPRPGEVGRVSRLLGEHLGHHRVGHAQGLQGLGRPSAHPRHRRLRRPLRRRRLPDDRARHHACPS